MSGKLIGAVGAIATVLAIGVASTSATTAGTKVSCSVKITAVPPAGSLSDSATATKGTQFGYVSCGSPLGKGVQADTYTLTPKSATTGTVAGPFTEYFATGTITGKFSLNVSGTKFTGTYTVTSGTAAFKGAGATGPLDCTTPDAVHISCTGSLTFAKV